MRATRVATLACCSAILALGCACSERPESSAELQVSDQTPAQAALPTEPQEPGGVHAVRALSKPPTLVGLDGSYHPMAVYPVAPGAPRLYARALRAWVHEAPRSGSQRLGYLRAGASSPTSAEPAGRDGCSGGWYPVEPRGFVCLDGRVTLDREDPIVQATLEYPPDKSRKLPYTYGTVRRPGPFYARVPTRNELEKAEPGFEQRMEQWLSLPGEDGASFAQHVWLRGETEAPAPRVLWEKRISGELPSFITGEKGTPNIRNEPRYRDALVLGTMPLRLGYGILETFVAEGRRYALTTDLVVVPTDRLRPIQGSDFKGVQIGKDVDFPFAFVRHPQARYFTFSRDKGLVDAGRAEYRKVVRLSGKQQFFSGQLHYETEDGKWLKDSHASRVEPAKKLPGWALRGERWIDVNLTRQLLVLYEGVDPVYATLVSTGEAGLEDPEHTTATKRGIFRIHTKHVTATMSSNELGEEFELRDVPYVQYFDKGGYALHGAYWHDRFGMPKSHGCINLSPEDARRVFHFTEPEVPQGWHGALTARNGTVLFVHP